MKNYFILSILFLLSQIPGVAIAQQYCYESIYFSVDQLGNVSISPDNLVQGIPVPGTQLSLDQVNYVDVLHFTCDDLDPDTGAVNKTIYVKRPDGEECSSVAMIQNRNVPVVIVTDTVTLFLDTVSDVKELGSDEADQGSYMVCGNNFTLQLSKTTFTGEDIGLNTVELIGKNSYGDTSSAFFVVKVATQCDNFAEMLVWPEEVITVVEDSPNGEVLSPENLVENHGYTLGQVYPQILNTSCPTEITYKDIRINITDGNDLNYKIVRDFTVTDWTGSKNYEFRQVIRSYKSSYSICDYLPRTAPVGDCASGHTLDDLVEWPADITISDHRLNPDQLVAFSGVDSMDARPTFYANNFSTQFSTILDSIVPPTIFITRTWDVSRGFTSEHWTYNQKINVDMSNFNQLVTTVDAYGHALSDVLINNEIMTDESGKAYVSGGVSSIKKAVTSNEGITVKDLTMIHEYILGKRSLTTDQLRIADLNKDLEVSAQDLDQIKDFALGKNVADLEYYFSSANPNYSEYLNGAFLGHKPGDIDVSSSINAELADENVITMEDVLLNNGEQYNVPLVLNNNVNMISYQVTLDIDADRLEVLDVTYEDTKFIEWNYSDGKLTIMGILADDGEKIFNEGDIIGTLVVKAKANTVLQNVVTLSADKIVLDSSYDLNTVGGGITGSIPNRTKELVEDVFKVYPNPTSDRINVNFAQEIKDYSLALHDMRGKVVLQESNVNFLDGSSLSPGVYILELTTDNMISREKIMILE